MPFGVTKTCCNHGNQGQQDIEKHENVMDVYVKCFQKDHVKTQSIVSNKQINNKFEQMKRWLLINLPDVFYDYQFYVVTMQLNFANFIATWIMVEALKNDN